MAEAHNPVGGLALDAAGNVADLPRGLADCINADVLDVMTLLACARSEARKCLGVSEDGGTTDPASRAVSLTRMAEDKLRGILDALGPYV